MRSVVITGLGAIGPGGVSVAGMLADAASARAAFAQWPPDQQPPSATAKIATAGGFDKTRYYTERQLRMLDRAMQLSSYAAGLALEDAGLVDDPQRGETAAFLSTKRGEYPSSHRFVAPVLKGGNGNLKAADFPYIARNISCGQVAIRFGLKGHSTFLASGSKASIEAIERAFQFIRQGRCSTAIAGGFETLSRLSLYLARHLYGEALGAPRPAFFGQGTGYLTPSEGACVLVLEAENRARARGAPIYARIDAAASARIGRAGWGTALEDGLARLLARADGDLRRVALLSLASGGSNRPHECAERDWAAALAAADTPARICAPRSLVGEGETWTSALQVAIAAAALREGHIPGTLDLAKDADTALARRCEAGPLEGDSAVVCGLEAYGSYSMLHLSKAA